uniref:Uncharacterized protein n=1 Tax=Kalanchoe fedtschenkoi TaxID=63787 RepID=A0A7N0TZV0_KALFE
MAVGLGIQATTAGLMGDSGISPDVLRSGDSVGMVTSPGQRETWWLSGQRCAGRRACPRPPPPPPTTSLGVVV